GMGTDGARGLLALRRAGWTTLAQDQDTSVVWGMPGAAVQCGAATRALGIDQIGPAILAHFSESGTHRP
ncbi:MAG: chemotaxis protein CheB, partial [Planctomycetota bacterium]